MMIIPSQEAILDSMPGLVACMNLDREITYGNHMTALTIGYNNVDEMLGTRLENIPCEASRHANVFAEQNREVCQTQSMQKYLEIHPFKNAVQALFVIKSPLYIEDKTLGVVCHCTPVNKSLLLDMSMAIVQSDRKFRPNNNVSNRSYRISNSPLTAKLSKRELECLFYLVRGKVASEISFILSLSKRTVESYLENIKCKLSCTSKSDLIEKALENNFIDFIPESLLLTKEKNLSILLG